MYRMVFKRLMDVVLSSVAALVLSPVLLVTALAIRLDDRGPAIFVQDRAGRDGVRFRLFKFRSMPVNTGHVPSTQAVRLRVTRVGRIIRRTNIDELPQLFNIIKGDMSIVGPRPALPTQEELLRLRAMNGAASCRPGLTGLAQVKSYDGMPEVEKAEYDGRYARSISFLTDVGIIARTFAYLLKRPPVY